MRARTNDGAPCPRCHGPLPIGRDDTAVLTCVNGLRRCRGAPRLSHCILNLYHDQHEGNTCSPHLGQPRPAKNRNSKLFGASQHCARTCSMIADFVMCPRPISSTTRTHLQCSTYAKHLLDSFGLYLDFTGASQSGGGGSSLTPLVEFYSKLPKGPNPHTSGYGFKSRFFNGKNASGFPLAALIGSILIGGYTLDYHSAYPIPLRLIIAF